jgi:hypothetical protein
MIRDPSDGSVREKPETGIPASRIAGSGPVIDTSTSGLPITKADYRLEESRKWLKEYVRSTING